MSTTTRGRIGVAAILGISLLGVTACTGAADAEETTETSSGDFEAVTIEHALGEAVVTEKPERIVTLGQGSTETAIALGTVPVGMEEYAWGSDETGYMPWIHEAVTENGDELPAQFAGSTELDIEAIVELEPDLILAPWSGLTQEQFDVLTDIAPTVAYPELPWTITWQEQIEVIGEALGQEEDAAALVAEIDEQLSESARPEYEGITFSYIYNSGPGTLGVFFPTEQRVAMVSALGLTVDPVVESLREYEVEGTDSASIGLENADRLADSDLVFTFYSDEESRAEIEGQDLYQQIPAIARGTVVAPTDQPFVTGSSIINPLTVPWALERFIPLIDEAVAKLDR
ncbi:iron-siderophore ABC transporter substrate-binding protein [Microbacterium betulae]|uniref:Iron-siderophore ABC transporter substrate-binding protein n=1 Tax=Microbacterium betulae TaxID=2981139 RepID=A0AA97I6H5_9MICO|nr:iron-siderophore ABC transporter substrate-binding protein [Microbacterium sp. AB]WOF22455.1 iron-siderophore ABC transporter substrate-binding protein [Microbacterium sp. AB]